MRSLRICLVVLALGLLATGCATYKVTHELEAPLQRGSCKVLRLTDMLPPDMDEEDRPTEAEVGHLMTSIERELTLKGPFSGIEPYSDTTRYVVSGTILMFRRGSGAVRFLIGFGLGDAKITVDMKLMERASGTVLFSGNFSQSISNWAEKGDKMYDKIAKDFVNALTKRVKKLGSTAKSPEATS